MPSPEWNENAAFEDWLGKLLKQSPFEIRRLLEDQRAHNFLITWSIFEAKCFDGFLREDNLETKASLLAADACFPNAELVEHARCFHERYQSKEKLRNLLHKVSSTSSMQTKLNAVLKREFESLGRMDLLFLAMCVTYRFRNNIFHGNKGVESWLKYGDLIWRCTQVMQICVTCQESANPSMSMREAA